MTHVAPDTIVELVDELPDEGLVLRAPGRLLSPIEFVLAMLRLLTQENINHAPEQGA